MPRLQWSSSETRVAHNNHSVICVHLISSRGLLSLPLKILLQFALQHKVTMVVTHDTPNWPLVVTYHEVQFFLGSLEATVSKLGCSVNKFELDLFKVLP